MWATLDISYDDFIRTTEERHMKIVQHFFQKLYDQGDIYKGVYKGLYCTNCEAYYTEDELKEGNICPVHERPVEWVEEESYFFRLSKYGERLLQHIEENPEFVQPVSRRNEVVSFIKQGLEDLSVSRTSFRWGVPVPFDDKHVIYVWIDALTNYITALGYPTTSATRRCGRPTCTSSARTFCASTRLFGRRCSWRWICRCRSGVRPRLAPHRRRQNRQIRAGDKSSTRSCSCEKYGVDAVRYFLLREVPFGADGTYRKKRSSVRINADLANDLGNLVWRTVSMIERFTDGTHSGAGRGREDDGVLRETARRCLAKSKRRWSGWSWTRRCRHCGICPSASTSTSTKTCRGSCASKGGMRSSHGAVQRRGSDSSVWRAA